MTKPVIFGISGTKLTEDEINLFTKNEVTGFILFSRNIEAKNQLLELTKSLKEFYPDKEKLIFVDQEGGRVARIKPPIASKLFPSAEHFASIYQQNELQAKKELKANYNELMSELKLFGIDSACAPVCDIKYDYANNIIGDRSFGDNKEQVINLCKSAIAGIKLANGIPLIKHIPGHGRAKVDSHLELPSIDASLNDLESTDFRVFKELSHEDIWAMTAHIIYTSLDSQNPVTVSKAAIEYIRKQIGFKGKLITDDICMYALHGEIGKQHALLTKIIKIADEGKQWKEKFGAILEKILGINVWDIGNSILIEHCNRKLKEIKPIFLESLKNNTKMSLDAGCDYVLHCSGDIEEMQAVCEVL